MNHPNLSQHMWNEVDSTSASKQDLNGICLSKEVLTINQLVQSLNSGFTSECTDLI